MNDFMNLTSNYTKIPTSLIEATQFSMRERHLAVMLLYRGRKAITKTALMKLADVGSTKTLDKYLKTLREAGVVSWTKSKYLDNHLKYSVHWPPKLPQKRIELVASDDDDSYYGWITGPI